MESQYITNSKIDERMPTIIRYSTLLLCVLFIVLSSTVPFKLSVILTLVTALCLLLVITLLKQAKMSFTLTQTHLQQHTHKGGWLLSWQNISQIDVCTYDHQGWHTPLPWIGIRINHYQPFLDSVCPRIISEILLSQRTVLFLGYKQIKQQNLGNKASGNVTTAQTEFEDIVLDSSTYIDEEGRQFTGLKAMLANRMKYQREVNGFDIFISTADLDRPAADFLGVLRRYLAASYHH